MYLPKSFFQIVLSVKIFIQCFPQTPGRASQMHFWQSVAAKMSLMQVWISSMEFKWPQSAIASEDEHFDDDDHDDEEEDDHDMMTILMIW